MKTVFLKIALALAGVLLGLVVLEGAVRLLPPPSSADLGYDDYGDLFVCSPVAGWIGQPDYSGVYVRDEFAHPIQFNGQGMYDGAYPFARPDNTVRILWVGDSYAQALQVEAGQTAQHQLETLLNERLGGPDLQFEVISTAVVGWGTAQQLQYYREVARQYQADVVLLLFYIGNDIREVLPGHAFTVQGKNCFAPYFPVCADGQVASEPWPYVPGVAAAWDSCGAGHKALSEGLAAVKRHSALFARIEPLLILAQPRRVYGEDYGLHYAPLYLPGEPEPELAHGWRVSEGLLGQFQQAAAADGARFAVATIGPKTVVEMARLNAEQLAYFTESQPVFAGAEIDLPNQRIAAFLQGQGVPVLDLQGPMVAYIQQTDAELYFPVDRHWTVEGNRVAAEMIFGWLVEEGLVANPRGEAQ